MLERLRSKTLRVPRSASNVRANSARESWRPRRWCTCQNATADTTARSATSPMVLMRTRRLFPCTRDTKSRVLGKRRRTPVVVESGLLV